MTNTRYPGVWRGLHWLIAALVIVLLVLGIWMVTRSEADLWDDLTNILYAWHKAIGFTVLMLMIVRVCVRLFCAAPPPAPLSPWARRAAHAVHMTLYLLLLIVPLLGWAGVSAYPALNIFAGLTLPALPGIQSDQALARQFFDIHSTLAYVLLVLVVLHIAAALKHRWIDKDGVYERMSLTRKSGP